MSVTAISPALDIDGPLPVVPEHTLLSIPGVLQTEDAGRRLGGVVVYGYPPSTPEAWEPCASGTFRTKEEGGEISTPRFDAVGLYVPITCSAISFGSNWRDFAERAERVLEATISFGIETVLSQGVVGSANSYLGDGSVSVLSGAAETPYTGLARLEKAIGATGRKGVIHAPREVVSVWSQHLRVVGDHLETFNGTPVAAGGGYSAATANGVAAGTGNAWAFASGPVEVYLGPTSLVGDDINGTLDTSNNDVTFRAEQFVLAEWDTELQVATQIDWTP